jgi:hypothetical protein
MSAYMVDKEHVIYMIQAAISRRLAEYDGGAIRWYHNGQSYELRCTATAYERASVANMLWRENLRSINHRYPDTVENQKNAPGKVSDAEEGYAVRPHDFQNIHGAHFHNFDPVQVIKAIHCYEYQSCEHPGWKDSQARAFVDALESKAVQALPGYEDAAWGAPTRVNQK